MRDFTKNYFHLNSSAVYNSSAKNQPIRKFAQTKMENRTHFDGALGASFKRCEIVPLQIMDQQQPVQPLPEPPAPQEPTPQPVQPQLVEPTPQLVEQTPQVVEPMPQLPQLQGEGEQQLGGILEIQLGQGRNVEDLEASDMLLALEQGNIPENIMEGDVEDQNVVEEGEGNVDDDDYEDGEEDYMVGGGDEVQETVVTLPLDDDE